jgi:glycosyltransferase involved in cell wall biosynthesis
LLDDGSIDGTLDICKQYAGQDNRIQVYAHDNKGVSYTRNRGIELAQGDYIMFIDGDDYVKPDYIQIHLVHYAQDTIVISGFLNQKDDKIIKNINFTRILNSSDFKIFVYQDILKLIEHDVVSTPCCKLYDSQVIKFNSIFFDENLSYQEDLIFNLEYFSFLKNYKIIDYFGYHYVAHNTSSTSRYHKNFNHTNKLFKQLVLLVRNKNEKELLKEFILQSLMRKIANIFHKNNLDTFLQKNNNVNTVLKSEEFAYSKDFIKKLELNFLLKKILQSKSAFLLSSYFIFKNLIFRK